MKIYIQNSQIHLNLIDSNIFHKTSVVTKFFTNSGIYLISNEDNNTIRKLQIIDKPPILHKKHNFIIDNSQLLYIKQVYQIPYHYHKEIYKIHTILVNEILKIYLNIEISKNNPTEFYFYVETTEHKKEEKKKDKKDDNIENILNNISTFLSSYNFIECI